MQKAAAFSSRIEESALTSNSTVLGDVAKEICTIDLDDPEGATLKPADDQTFCERLLETIGRANVTRNTLSFVSAWLVDK